MSLLLALLRKRLAEFDAGGGDTRLVLTRDEIAELLRLFLPDGSNEARLIDQVDTHHRTASSSWASCAACAGTDGMFEVRRILKAFVDAQWLGEFDARLAAYRAQLPTRAEAQAGGA